MCHPSFSFENYILTSISDVPVKNLLNYHLRNKTFHATSSPIREAKFYDLENWIKIQNHYLDEFKSGQKICFVILEKNQVVGCINFDNIIRGPFQSCYLGYSLNLNFEGKGIMVRSLSLAIPHILETLNLNRIMANYMDDNLRSGNLLRNLGFIEEGFAEDYLYLNGKWKDHVLTSLTRRRYVSRLKREI